MDGHTWKPSSLSGKGSSWHVQSILHNQHLSLDFLELKVFPPGNRLFCLLAQLAASIICDISGWFYMWHLLLGEVLSVYEWWFYTPVIVCEEKLRR